MDDRSSEESLEALGRLGDSAEHEASLSEARPLRLRRLDPAARSPFNRAETFFAGPARTAERPWLQPLVAAGLALTLAGSLVALPLVGGGPSPGTPRPGLALPAEVPGLGIEVALPQPSGPVEEGGAVSPPLPAPTTPGGEATAPAPVAPATEDGGTTDDEVVPPIVPPFPPVPPVAGDERPAPPPPAPAPPAPPTPQPPAGPPGPSIIGANGFMGEDPDGEEPLGEEPDGEEPQEEPDGDDPDGDDPDGDDPDGDDPDGEEPQEDPDGEDPDGEEPQEDGEDEGLPLCKEEEDEGAEGAEGAGGPDSDRT